MATERMFLMCTGCKGLLMLGKRLSVGYYQAPEKQKLEDFFDRHECPPCINDTLDNFKIIFEKDEDFALERIEGWTTSSS